MNEKNVLPIAARIVARTVALWLCIAGSSVQAQKRAILIGFDGVQYEELRRVSPPNFDRLEMSKAYVGGIAGENSQQATSSGPGWTTVLTGVWVDKHKVSTNSSGLASPDYPSLFRHIHNYDSSLTQASIINWSSIHTQYFANDLSLIDRVESGLTDSNVASAAIEEINKNTDFIFLQLDEPDGVGHDHGFGSEYDQSLREADQRLGDILDAIDQSEQNTNSEWLVLVTTDHGRTPGSGTGHGGQSESEKTVFIASNQSLNEEFTQHTVPANSDYSGLYGYPALTALTPTVLAWLGAPLAQEWKMDSPSLYGDVGVRKLMKGNRGELTWISDSDQLVEIFKNDLPVETIQASSQQWRDPEPSDAGFVDYVLSLNANPVAYRLNTVDINAAFSWDTTRSYMFRNDAQYIRYNKVTDRSVSGYPRPTDNNNWLGLEPYQQLIVASFYKDSTTAYFFLADGRYLSYNLTLDKVRDGYPKAIDANTWPGMENYATSISATLRWKGDKVYFFLKSGDYVRFDLGDDKADAGYPRPTNNANWPGLEPYATEIIATLKWNNDRAYFFLENQQYIRYSIANDRIDSGYPAATNGNSWPGLLAP
ncbi:alkaline phosphatase family protein [Endozoicomonas euniceicola]|uniref:Alkaline phosphatase family protein n=1 Tax=Endozoicomonas euniceicola TaxID=1234143 RepID=A0ABY6GUV9_9GAMM|nr:alkaline phosphatase family protein [Endozoicomonas euniceicola]UYM15823.1 alkaline phosphatase family protein [Endozoicomonas euniceicola]